MFIDLAGKTKPSAPHERNPKQRFESIFRSAGAGKNLMQHHDYEHFVPPEPVVVVEDLAQEPKKRGLNEVENACSR
jgi:hypothetical protein